VPVSDVSRWHRIGVADVVVPEPVMIRCARCGFATEGQLEQAREAFAAHSCSAERVLGDRLT